MDNTKEYILCAAVRRKVPNRAEPYNEGTNDICKVELGYCHHDIYQRFNDRDVHPDYADCPLINTMEAQGFYTSKGRFVGRYEAMELAYNAGQVNAGTALGKDGRFKKLFSEDLY